jgi:hypothetical protein
LLRRLNSSKCKDLGYKFDNIPSNNLVIQAYADDILLFADSLDHLLKELEIIHEFLELSNIFLNPKKCELFKTRYGEKHVNCIKVIDREKREGVEIKCIDITGTIKYLGMPLGSRRLGKMKFSETKFSQMEKELDRIVNSGLKVSQIINAIKTFILPKVDYLFRHSVVAQGKIKQFDSLIRKRIKAMIGGPMLSKDMIYSDWKDGGLGITCLEERYPICKIVNLCHLLNGEIREKILNEIDFVRKTRNIPLLDEDETQEPVFFDWKIGDNYEIQDMKGGYHCMLLEAFRAVRKLNLNIYHDRETNQTSVWDMESNFYFSEDILINKTSRDLMKMIRTRHWKQLTNQVLHGHTFFTLQNSTASNFMIGNCKAPVSNALFRFTVRARNNTLWTPQIKSIIFKDQGNSSLCNCYNNRVCSLLHILNNCCKNLSLMTDRHNRVLNKFRSAIKIHCKNIEEIHENQKVLIDQKYFKVKQSEECNLRPDLWFWQKVSNDEERRRILWIVECSIPYGKGVADVDGNMIKKTLKLSREKKIVKYKRYLDSISKFLKDRDDEGYKREIRTVFLIVSSLGAIPWSSISDMNSILKCGRQTLILWSKRLSIEALKGSQLFWIHGSGDLHRLMAPEKEVEDVLEEQQKEGILPENPEEQ